MDQTAVQFISLTFAVFLLLTLFVYWSLERSGFRYQNLIVLFASCVFYGWSDYRFVSLLLLGTLCEYMVGRRLMVAVHPWHRKVLLGISLVADLGALAVFKYLNFFVSSFVRILQSLGFHADVNSLNILLPLGISFFTLQRLSYTLEIYRGRLAATRDFVSFAAFSCYFPLLLSGPIERASQLLPQFMKQRVFDLEKSKDGLRQILWGLFKKMVIADNLSMRVDFIFSNYSSLPGIELAIGAFLFAIQLYADFSGYSDIAIGLSRLLGFRVTKNFAYPYFSRDMAEFWRRWHISLSFWFRDYVYTPLTWKVSLQARLRRMGCVLLTFGASGLWHGAAWTFVVWGVLHGLGFAPLVFRTVPALDTRQVAEGRHLPTGLEMLQMAATFGFVLLAWIFFRANSVDHAVHYIIHMLSHSWLVVPISKRFLLLAVAFLIFEWTRRTHEHPLDMRGLSLTQRWAAYCGMSLAILLFGGLGQVNFIYMRF